MTRFRIHYDPHALKQMAKRGITRRDVRTLLVIGQRSKAANWSTDNPKWRAGATINRRDLAIYFLCYPDHYYIITAMEVW